MYFIKQFIGPEDRAGQRRVLLPIEQTTWKPGQRGDVGDSAKL